MAKKTAKKRKRLSPGRSRDAKRAATILSAANIEGDRAAAAKFKVSDRSIRRWRFMAESGEWPELSLLMGVVKEAAMERCKDLLAEVNEMALLEMKKKIPSASYKELLDTVVETGGLKAFRDALGEGNEGGENSRSDPGGQEGQGTNKSYPGGAGIQKALRVVG